MLVSLYSVSLWSSLFLSRLRELITCTSQRSPIHRIRENRKSRHSWPKNDQQALSLGLRGSYMTGFKTIAINYRKHRQYWHPFSACIGNQLVDWLLLFQTLQACLMQNCRFQWPQFKRSLKIMLCCTNKNPSNILPTPKFVCYNFVVRLFIYGLEFFAVKKIFGVCISIFNPYRL